MSLVGAKFIPSLCGYRLLMQRERKKGDEREGEGQGVGEGWEPTDFCGHMIFLVVFKALLKHGRTSSM